MLEVFTATASGMAVLALGWNMRTTHSLAVDVAVIKVLLEKQTPSKKEKSNAKLVKFASQ